MAVGGRLLYNGVSPGLLAPVPSSRMRPDDWPEPGNLPPTAPGRPGGLGEPGRHRGHPGGDAWTRRGSRRALRKCLFLSIAVHVGLIVLVGTSPASSSSSGWTDRTGSRPGPTGRSGSRPGSPRGRRPRPTAGRPAKDAAAWDSGPGTASAWPAVELASPPTPRRGRPGGGPAAGRSPTSRSPRRSSPPLPEPTAGRRQGRRGQGPGASPGRGAGRPVGGRGGGRGECRDRPARPGPRHGPNPTPRVRGPGAAQPAPRPAAAPSRSPRNLPGPDVCRPRRSRRPPGEQVLQLTTVPRGRRRRRASPDDLDPGHGRAPASVDRGPAAPARPSAVGPDIRRAPRPSREDARPGLAPPSRLADTSAPPALARVTPTAPSNVPAPSPRPDFRRSLSEVPPVYRSRLDPNRTALAQRAGASLASEQAVEGEAPGSGSPGAGRRRRRWDRRRPQAAGRGWIPVISHDSFTHSLPGRRGLLRGMLLWLGRRHGD